MPAIVLVASGFGAGVFAGLALSPAAWIVWPAGAVLAAVVWRRAGALSLTVVAAVAGGLWASAAGARARDACAGRWREGQRVALLVEAWDVGPPGGRSRVSVVAGGPCRGRLLAVWPRGVAPPRRVAVAVGTWHEGARRGPRWWPTRPGAGGRLVVRRLRSLAADPGVRTRLRLATERRLVALFGWERFPLAGALTLGSSDQLEAGTRRRFAGAGLAHVLAISGLHVGILAAALAVVLRGAGAPPGRARLVAGAAVAVYVWLLGMPPPALRAVGLLAVWETARVRQRPPPRLTVFAVTAIVVLAYDPFAVADVGPWLSFAGAWGAVEGGRWWSAFRWPERWRERGLFGVARAAAVSLGATAATAPIGVLAFGAVPTAAVLTNLAALPVVGVLVPALALVVATSFVAPAAAPLAAASAGLLLDLLDLLAALGGALPFSSVAVVERGPAAAMLLAGGWLVRRLALPERRAPYPGIVRWRVATLGAAVAAAAVWRSLIPVPGSGYRPGWLEIHFLPVGEGDAAVMRTPAGRWVVIDGGPRTPGHDAGAATVVPFLRRNGARTLSVAVASHADVDHLGGLPAVLRAFPAALALEPGEPVGHATYREWLAEMRRAGTRWHAARTGDAVAVDGVVLRVVHPDSAWFRRGLRPNENSVVLRVEFGRFRALFPGDAGLPMEGIRAGAVGTVTVLKVAHHGSLSATGPSWLGALAPSVCVVSVGPNRFGHPAPEVLGALARAGCATYRTDRDGAVRIATDGRVAVVSTGVRQDSIPITPRGQP